MRGFHKKKLEVEITDKYEKLRNEIIDLVCDVIEEYYDITPRIFYSRY